MLASDADRDRVLLRLREEHVRGVLGAETFERRVDGALRARRRGQLDALLADLPPRRSALREALTAVLGPRGDAWPDAVAVTVPGGEAGRIVVGRSSGCDVRLRDPTVSARHVELRGLPEPEAWLAVDLGSFNGTWLDGRRLGRAVVHAGDVLVLGRTPVRLVTRPV